jgi:RNA polymerase sigma-70 factor (ECF subfamily)
MEDDKFILNQLKQGNHRVFKKLYDQHYYALKGFSRKYVSRNDVCDDVVQKAFVSLWENAEELKNTNAVKSYLYSAVRNGCLNYVNRESGKYVHNEELENVKSESYFDDSVMEEEVYNDVYLAIKNLSPQSRRIVLLTMNGLKNDEIAEDLDISVNTVKTLKKKAYYKLRTELKGASWVLFLCVV